MMTLNPFLGVWKYRSFHNNPAPVDDLSDILLWQADLTLESDGPRLVKGRIESDGYALEIRGSVSMDNGIHSVRFRGLGIAGSNTAGWIYDYSGTLASHWPDADEQRPSIVGTVMRTAPHEPNRPAGASYSFIAVSKTISETSYGLPEPVVAHFADRMHRLHHAVWHGVRNTWNGLQKNEQEAMAKLDWRIPADRVALILPSERTRPALSNGSGEDFLFFHRQMVVQYKELMRKAGATPIEWLELPQPGSPGANGLVNAVPEAWAIPIAPNFERRMVALKSDVFFWSRMRWWDFQFKDPTYLSTLTLGQLGALIEFSVHNDMHMRWSAAPRDPVTNELLPLGRPDEDNSTKWDNLRYDWLGEFYSSHVNPVFWRLHGWIDDRVNDWYAAHERKHTGDVQRVEKGGVEWFKPGHWVQVEHPWVWPQSLGGYESGHGHDDPDLRAKRIASAEKVMAILFPPEIGRLRTEKAIEQSDARSFRTSIVGF